MGRLTVLALRIALAMALAGSLFIQAVMVALLAVNSDDAGVDAIRVPVPVIVILGLVTFQVTLVCSPRRSPATPRRTICRPSWTR